MNTKTLLVIMSMLICFQQYGQTFDEYKKQQEEKFAAFKQRQQEFITQMQGEFDEYVKQKDQEFAAFLEEKWESYKVHEGEKPPAIPKPPVRPSYDIQKPIKKAATIKQLKNPLMEIVDGQMKAVIPPSIKKSAKPVSSALITELDFYGNEIVFEYDKSIVISPPEALSEQAISEFWLHFSESNFIHLLNQLQDYKFNLNLNDWAYYLLVNEFAAKVYEDSDYGKELMVWALLSHSGYKARVGYANNAISILLPTNNTLYSKQFLKADGFNFFVLNDLETNNIQTYGKDYQEAGKIMDFNVYKPFNFEEDIAQKQFSFSYQEKPYTISIDYNNNIIDFYKDYPQLNMEVYFNAAVSTTTKESVMRELSEIVLSMNEGQAVRFLLSFVQNAFNYQVDDEQFGKEKFLFAEETVFYPSSDCEDRSVLFAYLVKELLNLKVIGLDYPGHVSTAVMLTSNPEGDYVVFNNEKYIIADATYKNAPLGLSMPEYREKDPNVILLDNQNYQQSKDDSYWTLVAASGGYRGDNLNDLVYDDEGNVYLTGYFEGTAIFGDYTLETAQNQENRGAFIVKYDKEKSVKWAKRINSTQNATGFSIVNDEDGNLYTAGSFKGVIDAGGNNPALSCMENRSDIFIAKYSPDGQLIWIKKAGLDTYPQENFFTYNIKYSKDGSSRGTNFYSEVENTSNYGLSYQKNGDLSITGSFMNSTGFGLNMLTLKADEGELLDVSESLKLENDKLLEENCDQAIAGVFSVINHIKLNGFKMLGTDAQKTLDTYNPEFREEYPDIYKSIGKINFVFNNDGIVMLETENGKTVLIRELKLKDKARMKVVPKEDGTVVVEIFDGVQVGKFFIWFNLNYVKMFKSDGNLLFDYDKDHSQLIRNMRKHILR